MASEEEKNKKLSEESLNLRREELQVDKEILQILRRRTGLGEGEIRLQRDISNVLQDQVKSLELSANEKRKVRNITKQLNDLAEKTYTFDNKTLGITTKSEKVNKQILDAQQKLKVLALQKSKIYEKESHTFIRQASLRKEINQGIVDQIALSSRVIKQLERQAELAEEIEGNKIANSFGGIADQLNKIPLISALAPSFKAAEEAAREAGAEVSLFGKGMADASDYSKEGLAKLGPDAKVISDKKYTKDSSAVKKMAKKDPEKAKAMIGTNKELFGAAAQKSLEAGSAKLVGVNKTMASLTAGFSKMLPLLGKLAGAFALASLFEADKNITSFQKNLGVSKEEARKLNHEINVIAATSENLRVNITSLLKALTALNDAYGTAYMFNQQTLETSASILDAKLMDGEATARLAQSARLNGIEMEAALQSQEDAVNAVNKENNTRISLRKVLQDSNKIGGQLRAQLAANPEAISRAVTQARALGMELEQVASAGKQLLDFESSIENELTAELMLGRELNLEKARLAALTGDYETLTKEINKNVGDFGDFTKMNVLQQDALAASVGMTSDQLSDQLMKKADLEVLAQEALDRGDKQQYLDLKALSTQEKFEKAVLKVKEAFVSVMGAVEPLLTLMSGIFNVIGYVVGSVTALVGAFTGANEELGFMQSVLGSIVITYGLIAGYNKVTALYSGITKMNEIAKEKSILKQGLGMLKNLGIAIAEAVAKITGASAATLGVAAGIALASGAAAYAFLNAKKAGDVASPADGKTQISTKEGGLFELSKNDDVAAGPGILDKLKGAFSGGGLMGGMMGMLNPFSGLTSIITNIADVIATKLDELLGFIENKLFSKPIPVTIIGQNTPTDIQPMSVPITTPSLEENKQTTSIESSSTQTTSLEQKLDEIKKVLQQKQNITLDVNNKLTYDAFSENTTSYLNGKASQDQINDSSFV